MTRPTVPANFRRAIAVAAVACAVGACIGGALIATTASADPTKASDDRYTLKCWQEGVQIASFQERQGLRTFDMPRDRSATFENDDGSRHVIIPFGASLCIADLSKR